jgi:tRNA(fMet)-specific endonuclease VapC
VTARFLLDTDWIIDHFNGIAAITHRLEQLRPSGLALSVISLAELYEGVHYSRDPAASRRVLSGSWLG